MDEDIRCTWYVERERIKAIVKKERKKQFKKDYLNTISSFLRLCCIMYRHGSSSGS
jgi:hypothetical protein